MPQLREVGAWFYNLYTPVRTSAGRFFATPPRVLSLSNEQACGGVLTLRILPPMWSLRPNDDSAELDSVLFDRYFTHYFTRRADRDPEAELTVQSVKP